MASEGYADYKKQPTRPITISDFPPRVKAWIPSAIDYFNKHHIDVTKLNSVKFVYPTFRGICFPIDFGRLCFQERITQPGYLTRFWSPVGSPLGEVLYVPVTPALHEPLFVVEGLTDALAIRQSGYFSCAVVGAKVSEKQLEMLEGLSCKRPLYFIPDNDKAGEECNATLQKALTIRVRHLPTQYKDVCDMETADRHRFLKGAIK